MKVLVVGRGWIGGKVAGALGRTGCDYLMVSHEDAFGAINTFKPQTVINCAGYTGIPNVDQCEDLKALTIEANTLYPIMLYHACYEQGIAFAHFSTGCIYVGNNNFTEDDEPTFDLSTYSASKGVSDAYLKDRAVVFRIRMPFDGSRSPRNLLTKLDRYAKTARLVDSVNSISDADEMSEVAVKLLLSKCPIGAYHLVNTGAISTREIASYLGLSAQWMSWEQFSDAGHGARSVCTLSNAKAASIVPIRNVRDAVKTAAEWFRYHIETENSAETQPEAA